MGTYGNIDKVLNFRTPVIFLIINILQNFYCKINCRNYLLSNKNLTAELRRDLGSDSIY